MRAGTLNAVLIMLRNHCAALDGAWMQRRRALDTFRVVALAISTLCGDAGGLRATLATLGAPVSASGLCRAQQRMPVAVLHALLCSLPPLPVRAPAQHEPRLLPQGARRVLAIDGSKITLGPAMRAAFPPATRSPTHASALVSCAYDVERRDIVHIDVFDHQNERRAVTEAHLASGAVRAGDVLVFDRGYYSLALAHALLAAHVDFVFRVKATANRQLRAWMQQRQRGQPRAFRMHGVPQMRLVAYRVHGRQYYLFTSLARARADNALVARIYEARWRIEEAYKWYKHAARGRFMRARSLDGMRKEALLRSIFLRCAQALQPPAPVAAAAVPRRGPVAGRAVWSLRQRRVLLLRRIEAACARGPARYFVVWSAAGRLRFPARAAPLVFDVP